MFIENDGALFRGPAHNMPKEVYFAGRGWAPYADAGKPKGVEWGDEVDEATANEMMAKIDAKLKPKKN